VDKSYGSSVTKENGKNVKYQQLKKILHGCANSVLLQYKLFSSTLQDMGFEVNPYNACVANKITGSECTIVWYVDIT
jgi:hypothetical protein